MHCGCLWYWRPQMNAYLSLSIVVPVYSGEAFLPELVARQDALRSKLESSELAVRHVDRSRDALWAPEQKRLIA